VVSGAGGIGAAAGPLIGGLLTSAISWRASFLLQALVVAWIAFLARRIVDPPLPAERPRFVLYGAGLSVGRRSPGRRGAYTLRHLAELTMATSPDQKEPSVSEILLTVLAEALGAALVALLVAGARRLVGAALA
jgi:MFS family permease